MVRGGVKIENRENLGQSPNRGGGGGLKRFGNFNNDNNNRFIVQVISNIEQNFWNILIRFVGRL